MVARSIHLFGNLGWSTRHADIASASSALLECKNCIFLCVLTHFCLPGAGLVSEINKPTSLMRRTPAEEVVERLNKCQDASAASALF